MAGPSAALGLVVVVTSMVVLVPFVAAAPPTATPTAVPLSATNFHNTPPCLADQLLDLAPNYATQLLETTLMPTARAFHSGVAYSPTPKQPRMVIFGGFYSVPAVLDGFQLFNDVLTYNPQVNSWARFSEPSPANPATWPTPRAMHSANIVGTSMVVIGGWVASATGSGSTVTIQRNTVGDVWLLDLNSLRSGLALQWHKVATSSVDVQFHDRFGHSAVVFGGSVFVVGGMYFPPPAYPGELLEAQFLSDTWLWHLTLSPDRTGVWRAVKPTNNNFTPRAFAFAGKLNDVFVIGGGSLPNEKFAASDICVINIGDPTTVATTPPTQYTAQCQTCKPNQACPAVSYSAFANQPDSDRLRVFGGTQQPLSPNEVTFSFGFSSQLVASESTTYDVVVPAQCRTDIATCNVTIQTVNTQGEVTTANLLPFFGGLYQSPDPRQGSTLVAVDNAYLMFAGTNPYASNYLKDLWAIGSSQSLLPSAFVYWVQLQVTQAASPDPRQGSAVTRFQSNTADYILIFGGVGVRYTPLSQLWTYDLCTSTYTFVEVSPSVTSRTFMTASSFGPSGPVLFFGGVELHGDGTQRQLQELLLLTGSSPYRTDRFGFETLAISGAPPARSFHTAVVTSSVSMLVYGGTGTSGTLNDVWQFTFEPGNVRNGTWLRLSDHGPPRNGHSAAVLGPERGHMFVFGGCTESGLSCPVLASNEVWVFNIALRWWSSITASVVSAAPLPKLVNAVQSLAFDNRMVVHGGQTTEGIIVSSTYVLEYFGGDPTTHGNVVWTEVSSTDAAPNVYGGGLTFTYQDHPAMAEATTTNNWIVPFGGLTHDGVVTNALLAVMLTCQTGFVSAQYGAIPCTRCARGTFSNEDRTACVLCTPGLTTLDAGASSQQACVPESSSSVSVTDIVGIVFAVFGAQLLVLVLVLAVKRYRSLRVEIKDKDEMLELREQLLGQTQMEIDELKQAWVISCNDVVLKKRIDLESEGNNGEVWGAVWNELDVAVKKLRKVIIEIDDERAGEEFRQEADLLSKLRHPNVVLFFGAGVWHDGVPFLVTELMPKGSLTSLLQKEPGMAWKRKLRFAFDAAKGMNYLHSRSLLHRDLKSGNLLVSKHGTVKVADFGTSKLVSKLAAASDWQPINGSDSHYMTQATGTPLWMAPEVLGGTQYGQPADVFSYSVVCWEIAAQKLPWSDQTARHFTMTKYLAELEQGVRLEIPAGTPPAFRELIGRCWELDPDRRPTFAEIVAGEQAFILEGHEDDEGKVA